MANAWLLKSLAAASVTADTTSLGSPSHVLNDYAGVIWQSAAGTAARLVVDLGSDVTIDSLMLFGFYAPDSTMLTVRGATAAQGAGFAAGQFQASPGQPAFAGSERTAASGAGVALWTAPAGWLPCRYVHITFELPVTGAVRIGRLVIGRRFQPDRNFVYGAGIGLRDLGTLDWSRRGIPLRKCGARLRLALLTFSNTSREEVERRVLPLLDAAGNTEMLALVTDPQPDPLRERRCFFGALNGDLSAIQRNAVAWEWKAALVGPF